MPTIKAEITGAIELLKRGETNEALEALGNALEHLRSQQVAFLRNRALVQLHQRARLMVGKIPHSKIDKIYRDYLNPLSKYCEGRIELDEAARRYNEVLHLIACAFAEQDEIERKHQRAQREQELQAAKKQRERELQCCAETTGQLEELFSE
jgi:hypothetical protein